MRAGPMSITSAPTASPFTPYEYDKLSVASMYDGRRCNPRDETRVAVFARVGKRPQHRR